MQVTHMVTSIAVGPLLIWGCAGVSDPACLCRYPLAIQVLPELCSRYIQTLSLCCDEAEQIPGMAWCKLLCRLWAPVNLLIRAQCCWNTAVPFWEQKLPCQYSCAPPLAATWGLSLCHFPVHSLNMTKWWWSHMFWETRAQTCIFQVLGWHLVFKCCLYCYWS